MSEVVQNIRDQLLKSYPALESGGFVLVHCLKQNHITITPNEQNKVILLTQLYDEMKSLIVSHVEKFIESFVSLENDKT